MKASSVKTFTVSTEELIKNFVASNMDMLNSNVELASISPRDFSMDLESFSMQLKNLLCGKETFEEYQTLFREGYTTMLLDPTDVDYFELLDKNNEDYQLLLIDSNNHCLGVLQKDDITW